MFIGQHPSSLNKNNRVNIPASYAMLLDEGAVITQGFDRNIQVYTKAAFSEIAIIVRRLNLADPLARALQRMLLGNASLLKINAAGAINLPTGLKEYAGLEAKIVLVGQGDFFEIWSQAMWDPQEISIKDAETNSRRFAHMNLSRF